MITSIVVNGCHTIKENSNRKISLNGNILSVEKDIPFIRYRMDSYTQETINYMSRMMKQFSKSTHLAEIKLSANILNEMQLISQLDNVAIFVYADVTDADVANASLSMENKQIMQSLIGSRIDRFMLKDKSTSLSMVTADKMIKDVCAVLGLNKKDVGICSSPLSFGDLACLTSVRARELMSIYSTVADVALPTANHQCMNCCGCIRYIEVSNDTEAPAETKKTSTKSKDGKSSDSNVRTHKKNNNNLDASLQPGVFRFN